ncbi:MAG TPA: hypothetical protein VMR43_18115 [Variovorax sp.]|nr:hypothetical protein [Variovorax sp.]
MIAFLRRRSAARVDQSATDLPEVSQPMPLDDDEPLIDAVDQLSVTELSELEARALCAREDIPVFWPRPDQEQQRHG